MTDDIETYEYERDGFALTVRVTDDYDASPGDDDVSPRLTPHDYIRDEIEAGDLGPFTGVVQGEAYTVKAEEIERLADAWGTPIDKARAEIAKDAEAFADRSRRYVNIEVTATRNGASGSDYLGACDVFVWGHPDGWTLERQIRELAGWHEMGDTAISEAARQLMGADAALALGVE